MIYRPLYVDKIMAYVDTPFVKILTGVRRCGKSTILKMIMERLKTERNIPEERIVSCRYDSMEYEDMTAKQMYAELKERLSPEGKTYLFLNEVQEIKGWEKVINSLASESRACQLCTLGRFSCNTLAGVFPRRGLHHRAGYLQLHYLLGYCQAQSGEKNRPVGASNQIYLQQCRQYLLGKINLGLPEGGTPCAG